MTKGIQDFFDIPHLEDVLKEDGVLPKQAVDAEVTLDEQQTQAVIDNLDAASSSLALVSGQDHAEAMDQLYDETLKHAKDIMDLGFNIDHARAARMFEVGATMFKVALDAKNAKRDAQLKAMQVVLNQQKLELDKQIAKGDMNNTIDADAVIVEDRNELIKRLREQAKAEKKEV